MTKKPSILEGDIARTLGRVDKLKIANVKGGTRLWIPEDTVQTMTKRISKNGTYKAKDDDKYGYSEVIVNVPGNKVVGEGPDGNDHAISEVLDEDGNPTGDLTDNAVPSAINIVRPPYRVSYIAGESISFDGLSVVMLDKKGAVFTDSAHPNGVLQHSELEFPITIAGEGGGSSDEYSDGNGLNVKRISCDFECCYYNTRYGQWIPWIYVYTGGLGYKSDIGARITLGMGQPSVVMLTRYNNELYAARVSGVGDFSLAFENPQDPYGWGAAGGTTYTTSLGVFTGAAWDDVITEVPESTVNPAGRSIDDLQPAGGEGIPVNWDTGSYNLGKTFTDSFEINVTGGSSDSSGFSDYEGGTF